jgi:hypothetical protein
MRKKPALWVSSAISLFGAFLIVVDLKWEMDNSKPTASAPTSVNEAGRIADARAVFADELSKPAIRDRLMALTHKEVGSQGRQAQNALIETVINRAAARKQSLDQTMRLGYYPNMGNTNALSEEQRQQYGPMIDEAIGGANISNYATGNASKKVDVGAETFESQGERFGVEERDRAWADQKRAEALTTGSVKEDKQPYSWIVTYVGVLLAGIGIFGVLWSLGASKLSAT